MNIRAAHLSLCILVDLWDMLLKIKECSILNFDKTVLLIVPSRNSSSSPLHGEIWIQSTPALHPPNLPMFMYLCPRIGRYSQQFLLNILNIIQDFPRGGGGHQLPKWVYLFIIVIIFAENCMKMKEFGTPGRGGCASLALFLGSANVLVL